MTQKPNLTILKWIKSPLDPERVADNRAWWNEYFSDEAVKARHPELRGNSQPGPGTANTHEIETN